MNHSVLFGRSSRVRWATGALVGVVVAGSVLALSAPAIAAVPNGSTSKAGAADVYGFHTPTSAAVVGSDLFVANWGANSVTEVNASTGAFVASIAGPRFKFDGPRAIEAVGTQLFVANGAGKSVTDINAGSRSLVRTISGAQFKFTDPIALAADAQHLFVLNAIGSVTEVAVATGRLIAVSSGTRFGFDAPTAMALAGPNLFVTNRAGDSVTEINALTGAFEAKLAGSAYQFGHPSGITLAGKNLWVANETGGSVTEISAQTGSEESVVSSGYLPTPAPMTSGDGYVFTASPPGSSPMVTQITAHTGSVNWMMCNTNGPYLFNNPQALAVAGPDLWVVNEGGNSLTEMNAGSGALIGTFS